MLWKNSEAIKAIPFFSDVTIHDDIPFDKCSQVITMNGDAVKLQNFVIAQNSLVSNVSLNRILNFDTAYKDNVVIIGQVHKILCQHGIYNDSIIVTLRRFSLGAKHFVLNMPTIHVGMRTYSYMWRQR